MIMQATDAEGRLGITTDQKSAIRTEPANPPASIMVSGFFRNQGLSQNKFLPIDQKHNMRAWALRADD